MSNYLKYLEEYEKSQKTSANTGKSYDLKNYFSTYLKDGVANATKTIRILPNPEGGMFWTVLHGHKIQVDGSWKTFPCLKHEKDEPCPFCEARTALLATGKASDKELSKKYSARKMYIVKVIERGNEEEGVKFWRFNHSYKGDGTLDKLMECVRAVKHDIADSETGRDINVKIGRNQFGIPVVTSITYPLDSTKLSEDIDLKEEWLSDSRTWEDVYSVRDYNYLSIVVKGDIPVWSKEKETFVGKLTLEDNATEPIENFESELTLGGGVTKEVETVLTDEVKADDDEEDDLPF
tara:strand:- start:38223 stop:39101 length:879 start_codon:yes stop_codon:yes gene_type:complete